MGAYDDLIPGSKPAGGAYDDLIPSTSPTSTAVAEPSSEYERFIPQGLSGAEELQMEEQFSKEHPYIYGGAKALTGMIPKSWEEAKAMMRLPQPSKFETEELPASEQLGEAWRGEHGPIEQASSIVGTLLQGLPLAHLPFAETPLRPRAGDAALVQKLMEARDRELTPPPIPPEYAERRFTLQEPPPEPRPELAPAPPIEDVLAATEPQISPETGFTHFPGPEAAPEVPPRTETAAMPGTTEHARQVISERQQKLARAAELRAGGELGSEAELAEIDAWLKDPVKNPVVHAPPRTVPPEKVQPGEFKQEGYTALPTEEAPAPVLAPEAAPVAPEPYTPEAAAARAAEPAPVPEGGVPQKPSKIGLSIETKAVEAKLTEGFAETAGYDPITIADQAQRATSFVKSSPTDARAVIRGEAFLPKGLRGTSLITAMEEDLLRNPDAQVAYELANSPLTSATSAAAQEMRLMSERVPDSIAAKFQEIREARKAGSKLRGETPERVGQEIKQEIVRQSSKRPTWEAFVREITCA